MGKIINIMLLTKILEARIEAISECIGHLDLEWTDDPHEREAAVWLQGVLKQLENKTVDKLIYHK
jgi:hypothetical protein